MEEYGGQTSAIGGPSTEDSSSPARFPGVVYLNIPDNSPRRQSRCTGTLVSPSHVLTGAHCVSDWTGGAIRVTSSYHPENLGDSTTPVSDALFRTSTTRCEMHPRFADLFSDAECGGKGSWINSGALLGQIAPFDLALLTLPRAVPRSWLPPDTDGLISEGAQVDGPADPHRLLDESESELTNGDQVTIVGFGLTIPLVDGTTPLRSVGFRRYAVESVERAIDPDFGALVLGFGLPTVLPGDSGGPALGTEYRSVPYFAEPVVGVASSQGTEPVEGLFTFHTPMTPENRTWLRQAMERNNDGQWDLICGGVLGSNPAATPETDEDADGILNEDDICPNYFAPCQDRDRDGIGDCDDNCPSVYNPLQENTDVLEDGTPGDTFGDACDNCPNVPNQDQFDADELEGRNDGVGNACDNCEFALNPLQENCNEDVERARFLPLVGDACDPTPCGETLLSLSSEPTGGVFGERTTRLDVVEVDGVRDGEPLDAATGFRFCRCSAAAQDSQRNRANCIPDLLDGTGGCTLPDLDSYDFVRGREDRPWRLSDVAHTGTTVGADLFTEAVVPYEPQSAGFEAAVASIWNFEGDRERWALIATEEQARVDDPDDPLIAANRRFPEEEDIDDAQYVARGVFWTHTAGDESGTRFDDATRLNSNHYWSGIIPPPRTSRPPFPCLRYVGSLLPGFGCPQCGGAFPTPYVATPGSVVTNTCEPGPVPPLLALPDLPLDLSPVLAFDPEELFRQPDLRWLSPVESFDELRFVADRQNVSAIGSKLVGFNGQGQLAVRLVDTGQGIAPIYSGTPNPPGDPVGPPGDLIDPPDDLIDPPAFRVASESAPATESMEDALLFYSALRDTAWRIAQDGTQDGGSVRIEEFGVRQMVRRTFAVPELEGRTMLAGTFRSARFDAEEQSQDRLYLLTEREFFPFGWFRLRFIELVSVPADLSSIATRTANGDALNRESLRTEFQWIAPRRANNAPDYALAPSHDGAMWLLGDLPYGDVFGEGHFVMRLNERVRQRRGRASRDWRPSHVGFGEGHLSPLTPASERRGVSLVVTHGGLEELIGYRPSELHAIRSRDFRRCF